MSDTAYLCVRNTKGHIEAGIFSEPHPTSQRGYGPWECLAKVHDVDYGAAERHMEHEALTRPEFSPIRPAIERHIQERRRRERAWRGR